jgi:hypothetical protein
MSQESKDPSPEGRASDEGWQARLVYVCYLGSAVGSVVMILKALSSGSRYYCIPAVLSLIASIFAREWLRRTGSLVACYESLVNCEPADGPVLGGGAEESEFRALIARRVALEKTRGSPGFDVWEFQNVRKSLETFVTEHPAYAERLESMRRSR